VTKPRTRLIQQFDCDSFQNNGCALERSATVASTVFSLFEQRAGVWLALVLIAGVVTWAVR